VLIGKTNLSEWANFRSLASTSGWSSLGGQTRNPYRLDRNPCGSSSGSAVAVAARLVPLAVGTETDGSIVCPAGVNGVVGIKPTRGRMSNAGIVPVAESLDVAGPMARTVEDAALLLDAMLDAHAPADGEATPLRGVRIGVLRDYGGAGATPVDAAFDRWIGRLRRAGAQIVDPVQLGLDAPIGYAELELMLYEFKRGIDRYLAEVADGPRSLEDLIEFNRRNAAATMPHFGQELFEAAARTAAVGEEARLSALERGPKRMRALLERAFAGERLEALVAPVNPPAWPTDWSAGDRVGISSSRVAALSGYPSIAVPAELHEGLPLGLAFIGRPFEDERLIALAAAFEALRGPFPAPRFLAGEPP
jgi:amidase